MFSGLNKLETLILSRNLIENVDKNSFRHMVYLIQLDLKNNLIKSIDRGIFIGLKNLMQFDLSENPCNFCFIN